MFQFRRTSFFVQIDLCSRLKIISVTYCSLRGSYRYAMFQGKVICFFVQMKTFENRFSSRRQQNQRIWYTDCDTLAKLSSTLSQSANYIEKKFIEYIVTSYIYHRGWKESYFFFPFRT